MKAIFAISLLLLLWSCPSSSQVPGILWESQRGDYFYDVHETSTGDFIVAGRDIGTPNDDECIFRFTSDGLYLWDCGDPSLYYQEGMWVEETTAGEFVVVGRCKITQTSTYGLFLQKVSDDGNLLWTRVYDIDSSDERAYCVLPLPNGDFVICGEIDPETGMDQAWILLADANGDTLWTREWGWDYNDEARRIIFADGGLTVLTQGRLETTSGGPHIVRYDLNGNLLWETPIPEMYGYYGQDMCYSPSDGGYLILTHYGPWLAHTDSLGVFEWILPGRGASNPRGYSINTTMDQGYIYAGQSTPDPDIPGSTYSGMIVRYDSEGNEMWWDYVYNSDCDGLFSARQLSQGGYIAAGVAGGQGYLIRYEPEVGIGEEGEVQSTVQLVISPSPFSSSLTISYSLPESGHVNLSVFSLNGRLIEVLESSFFATGEHSRTWNPDPALPDGYYLIILDVCGERAVSRAVLLR